MNTMQSPTTAPALKPTPAQIALWHVVESVVVAALATAGTVGYQAFLAHGFNLQIILGLAGVAFGAALLRGYTTQISTNINLLPAMQDGFAQLKSSMDTFAVQHLNALTQIAQMTAATQRAISAPAPTLAPTSMSQAAPTPSVLPTLPTTAPPASYPIMTRMFPTASVPVVPPPQGQ